MVPINLILFFWISDPVDRQPLSPASLAKYDNILSKVALFYKYHGINIKCSYADFDKHNNGLVTESQVGS